MKIFIIIVLAIIVGSIIVKKLSIICAIFEIVLRFFAAIFLIPIKIFQTYTFSEDKCIKQIVKLYDKIFFEDSSKKEIKYHIEKIKKHNSYIKEIKGFFEDANVLELLKEYKWLL